MDNQWSFIPAALSLRTPRLTPAERCAVAPRRALMTVAALAALAAWLAPLSACALFDRNIEVTGRAWPLKASDGFDLWACRMAIKGREVNNSRAIVFYAQGSEDVSLFHSMDALAGFCEMNAPVYGVERRGVSPGAPDAPVDHAAALKYATFPTRVADSRQVLAWARAQHPSQGNSKTPVLLMGASEGGDVISAVAAAEKDIAGVVLLGSGGGWTQEEEFRHFIKTRGEAFGLRTTEQLDAAVAHIRAHPDSDELWLGHPLRRWSTFMFRKSADDLLKVDVPILLVQGAADDSVPIESARALKDLFTKAGKTNLTLVEIENADHRFMDTKTGVNKRPLVELAMVAWLRDRNMLSETEAALFEARVRKAHPEVFENAAALVPSEKGSTEKTPSEPASTEPSPPRVP